MASVGRHHQIGAHLQFSLLRGGADAFHAIALHKNARGLAFHSQMKAGIALRALGEKIQEIPLRHQHDEFAMGRQVRKIGHRHLLLADVRDEFANLLMRPLEKVFEQVELVQNFERRWMNRVAAKIAQEIAVLLSTTTSTPARASRKPSIIPAGPPPAMQQPAVTRSGVKFSSGSGARFAAIALADLLLPCRLELRPSFVFMRLQPFLIGKCRLEMAPKSRPFG